MLGLLLTSALVYGESVRDRSTMPMLLRRFVPVILPLSALCVGMLIDRLWRRGTIPRVLAASRRGPHWASSGRRMPGRSIAAAPMTGVHDELGRLAAALPADAIVVTDQTTPSHFGLSLRGTFGREVLWVRPTADTAGGARAAGAPDIASAGDCARAIGDGRCVDRA